MFMWFYHRRHKAETKTEPNYILPLPIETDLIKLEDQIDFVLVYNQSQLKDGDLTKIQTFLTNLKEMDLKIDTAPYSVNDKIIFIKIYAQTDALIDFAEIFGIELALQNPRYNFNLAKTLKFMRTELTDPDSSSPEFSRAKDTFLGVYNFITSAERSLVVYKVLSRIHFGSGDYDYGVDKLIKKRVLEGFYPLHDGPHQWTEEGPLNDRQLLVKYWSNFKCWYKDQPLDLIEKYYGPEVGLYFAWLGLYITMLIPAAVFGLLCFLLGIIIFRHDREVRNTEICNSEIYLCPFCIYEFCRYIPLNSFCGRSTLMYFIDNPLVLTFAILMSIWSTVFLELWKRKESKLQIKWNLKSSEKDYSMRPEFAKRATHSKIFGGLRIPYMTREEIFVRYFIVIFAMFFMLVFMGLAVLGITMASHNFGILVLQISERKSVFVEHLTVVKFALASTLAVILILLVDSQYKKVSFWLTKIENPRTQIDFNNSFTYKCYALSFICNYMPLFYLAFFRGKLYTYPGDVPMFKDLAGLRSAVCAPEGCLREVAVQLMYILIAKTLFRTLQQYVFPKFKVYRNKFLRKRIKDVKVTLQWEHDYVLNPANLNRFRIMGEYMQMISQYGFVTLFAAAFPLTPLFALCNNIVELRVDASKLTKSYRRNVAFKVPNLEVYKQILQTVTYVGVATNAFVFAFTTDFIERALYRFTEKYDLEGYINSTLSVFDVKDFSSVFEFDRSFNTCYYFGNRNPPQHPKKYQRDETYWIIFALRLTAVIIFEHFLVVVTRMMAYFIPDVTFSAKLAINHQKAQIRREEKKKMQDAFEKEIEITRVDLDQTL